MNTLDKLLDMMREIMPDTDVSGVTADTELMADLGLDSLNLMLLAISVEDRFGIMLGTDYNPGTVGELCAYIEKQQGQKR